MRSFSFPQTPNLSWQRPKGIPLWKPQNLCFLFYFLFLLLVFISFGYLAIYTNEHLLLNNVDSLDISYNFSSPVAHIIKNRYYISIDILKLFIWRHDKHFSLNSVEVFICKVCVANFLIICCFSLCCKTALKSQIGN